MIVVDQVSALRAHVARWRAQPRRIAFVPTMGNLHAGHMQLMHEARRHADIVIASIYVNPLQFGASEDFSTYPRTPAEDRAKLERAQVDMLFLPDDHEMYPRGTTLQTYVEVPGVGDILCGTSRPGHFRGVATVVNRFFNLVAPDVAVFGKKDYQQLLVVRTMVADLGVPVEVIGVETLREPDGLAFSSRNQYLTPPQRNTAPLLYQTLRQYRDDLFNRRSGAEARAIATLVHAGFRVDYVSARRVNDLGLPGEGDTNLVVLAAAWLGHTRLIDNIECEIAY